MVGKRALMVLLASAVAVLATKPVLADDCCAPACCAPATRTVRCTEWVPQNVTCTRTCYRTEYRTESYTAYRCESVPVMKTRVCTTYKMVPEVHTAVRNVCCQVPVVENRTVMQSYTTCKPVTCMVRKCEDHGHYECRQVPCRESIFARLKKHFHHHNDCCDSCEPCCPPPMKTVRVWVPCKVWVECPVTRMVRSCEYRPVTCQVTCYKTVTKQETYQYTCCKCVPVQTTQTYTCYTTRQVAVPCTRQVAVCVPYQQTYTVCKMVARCVEKQVPVTPCCETTCNSSPACGCGETCGSTCGRRCHHHRFGGFRHAGWHHSDCGCN